MLGYEVIHMHPGVFFMHLRHMLPWWSPAIIAWYGTLFFWAMDYPHRAVDEAPFEFSEPPSQIVSFWYAMFFWGCAFFYAMWFALAHTGTEFLVDFFTVPSILMIVGFFLLKWFMSFMDFLDNTDPGGGASKGLTYSEWQIFEARRRVRDKKLAVQRAQESVIPELRRARLIVFPGMKDESKRGDRA
ncbi:hypothetical protein URH17368_0025 [Alicyclobacillus hesperidum URH17-3-68]|nr:hypothetical protein URH17368_0025 [Alicyclobacillus hesperidum URH17-3-68]